MCTVVPGEVKVFGSIFNNDNIARFVIGKNKIGQINLNVFLIKYGRVVGKR